MDFLEELRWRGLIHELTPGVEEHLKSGVIRGYIGFDPTAPSLTIGNYVQIMLLTFLQRAGHQPVALMGGATGRIGDPSGRDSERELKSYEELDRNTAFQQKQIERLLNTHSDAPNRALILNNLDFYADMNVMDFLRDVGKYLTVNYMLSKESVQRRLESGISFTEFSYQLLQGYDFVLLNQKHGITLQMGGSDQYGNITAGIELARKIAETKLFAVVTPLLTKADGTKFGKSTSGNIWLDPELTSPYRFYQFWINADDRDLPKFLRYFSLKDRAEIEALEATGDMQLIKRTFAEEITTRVHGEAEFAAVQAVSQLLFNPKAGPETLRSLDARTLSQVAEEIPAPELSMSIVQNNCNILDFLSEHTGILSSRSEAKKAIQNNAISINKEKITDLDVSLAPADLLHGRYLMVENGKKNKFLVQLV
ncbi:MAG: tyrosine--tRNA ligase [Lewinellaceae bacterium]|nr:tyrosine--tRNA ligase [Saprospiraceae bacterium]MCB9315870.1 tyrosine--tRNA ligase [Lewinellaceae bacterium]MCB9330601.1 tyrosine--tRNA ligase [Lewinellaceae bacterium]